MSEEQKKDTPTFEEVVKRRADHEPEYSGIRPDRPYHTGPRGYGDEYHVNPALAETPLWAPQPERVVVPVVNDPGVLGAAPALADLNRSYRADDTERGGVLGPARRTVAVRENQGGERPDIDDTQGMTEQDNREEIRRAAEARMEKLHKQEDRTLERYQADMEANQKIADMQRERAERGAEFQKQENEDEAAMRNKAQGGQSGGSSQKQQQNPEHAEAERKREEARKAREAERGNK